MRTAFRKYCTTPAFIPHPLFSSESEFSQILKAKILGSRQSGSSILTSTKPRFRDSLAVNETMKYFMDNGYIPSAGSAVDLKSLCERSWGCCRSGCGLATDLQLEELEISWKRFYVVIPHYSGMVQWGCPPSLEFFLPNKNKNCSTMWPAIWSRSCTTAAVCKLGAWIKSEPASRRSKLPRTWIDVAWLQLHMHVYSNYYRSRMQRAYGIHLQFLCLEVIRRENPSSAHDASSCDLTSHKRRCQN